MGLESSSNFDNQLKSNFTHFKTKFDVNDLFHTKGSKILSERLPQCFLFSLIREEGVYHCKDNSKNIIERLDFNLRPEQFSGKVL